MAQAQRHRFYDSGGRSQSLKTIPSSPYEDEVQDMVDFSAATTQHMNSKGQLSAPDEL